MATKKLLSFMFSTHNDFNSSKLDAFWSTKQTVERGLMLTNVFLLNTDK